MNDSKIEYSINKGLERLQSNSKFPPKSIIDDDKFIPNYAFTNNDYKLFCNWITVIMEVKAIDMSKSFFIPCILRKIPEQRSDGRINDIYYEGCNQFSINESYIEDLEIVLNEKYFKILGENNFLQGVYCENGEPKLPDYSFNINDISVNMMKLDSRKCNLVFYPYSFDILAYTSSRSAWNNELINISIIEDVTDESFHNIKRLSKQYFTINDVSLGTFISKLPLNQEYNGNGYDNIIMRCTCNSLSLAFYENITLTVDKIENHVITDSISNRVYTKNKKNKSDIIINDEFLI